ncbi:hypothetical protein WBG78_12820 [Chryseolinea sp. T2]|uniref:hypothetical protein n=1 Tax=Chryseolinea sp. T2 TaxID=3129255 RepID=UPI003077037B
MPGLIVIEPFGGLGNRMRVIVSAIALSKSLGKDLKVIWKTGEDLKCSFNRLFEPINNVNIVQENVGTIYSSFNKSWIKRKTIQAINLLNGFNLVVHEQDHSIVFADDATARKILQTYTNVYIRSCEHFYLADNDWTVFAPIQQLRIVIDDLIQNFKPNIVGVHIRRTDNYKSIQVSSLDKFIELLNDHSIKQCFLATDDPLVLHELSSRIADNRLIIYSKEFTRSTEKGVQDALIELFCLANCSKIYGSYWSSYSEVASYLQNKELIIVGSRPDIAG